MNESKVRLAMERMEMERSGRAVGVSCRDASLLRPSGARRQRRDTGPDPEKVTSVAVRTADREWLRQLSHDTGMKIGALLRYALGLLYQAHRDGRLPRMPDGADGRGA